MEERDKNCEENCFYFAALSPEQKILNRKARLVTLKGEEFPDSPNTLCGGCVRSKIINSFLDKKISEFVKHKN